MYRHCPSAKTVSKAREDLPEPETPVMTVTRSWGMARETFFRLFCLAPSIRSQRGCAIRSVLLRWKVYPTLPLPGNPMPLTALRQFASPDQLSPRLAAEPLSSNCHVASGLASPPRTFNSALASWLRPSARTPSKGLKQIAGKDPAEAIGYLRRAGRSNRGRPAAHERPHPHDPRHQEAGVLEAGRRRSGTASGLRHLQRLSALPAPLPVVQGPLRPARHRHGGRRRREAARPGRQGSGGPLLPVQALLQPLPVHAAPPLAGRLSPAHAARPLRGGEGRATP